MPIAYTPLDFNPENSLFCVRAIYTIKNPSNLKVSQSVALLLPASMLHVYQHLPAMLCWGHAVLVLVLLTDQRTMI